MRQHEVNKICFGMRLAEEFRDRTVFSLTLSAADSLKDTPLRKCEPICTGMVGSSQWMGWEVVCIRPACWASASLQQPCSHTHTHT